MEGRGIVMKPTEELMKEHETILVVLDVLERICTQIEEGSAFKPGDVGRILDFLRRFADGCHHAKEEKHLFPALEHAGIPRERGPIGVMLSEHELGRKYIAGIAAALERYGKEEEAAEEIVRSARAYSHLLRAHISKENQVLFPMAERVLPPNVQEEISGAFAHLEEVEIGKGVHERYHAMIHELRDAYLASPPGVP
jgi:hemerythrin-like domain-containing protein